MKAQSCQGEFTIVGVGPGDPELLTLKAVRSIEAADVVAYPTVSGGRGRAREIAAAHVCGQIELGFEVPMREDPRPAQMAYDAASAKIAEALDAGRNVVLLCEGDAFFYASAMYIHARLAGRYAIAVVPGVISLAACAAAAGQPLGSRNEVFRVVPAPLDEDALRAAFAGDGPIAVIKVGRHFEKVRGVLADLGRLNDAVIVEGAATPSQSVSRMAEFTGHKAPYFSTILVAGCMAAPGTAMKVDKA